jgi:hypothetical protein
MTEQKVSVAVSFQPNVGYVSEANHKVRSCTALSLDGLRRRIMVLILSRLARTQLWP